MTSVPSPPQLWCDAVQAEQLKADTEHAQVSGHDLVTYRLLTLRRLPTLLADAEIRMRIREDGLAGWLESGAFETFHSVGYTAGLADRTVRIEVEHGVLGVPADASPCDRPIYGYVHGSADELSSRITDYGKILVRLDDGLRQRATVTLGDSMGSTNRGNWACMSPEPLEQPVLLCRFANRDVVSAGNLVDACDPYYGYAEVQIYGPLYPHDIREVVFCYGVPATDTLRNRLANWEIPFYESNGDPE